jgi:hypothetical protein
MDVRQPPAASAGRSAAGACARLVLPLLLGVLWLYPWMGRLRYPALLSDDFNRVDSLQSDWLGERLTRPFNEHLAPCFELVTAAAWQVAGHRLGNAPAVFTATSYIPSVLCLALLWLLTWREWNSPPLASAVVSCFAATAVYAECVFWFSASTFSWALLFTLLGLWLTAEATRSRSPFAWVGAYVACIVAPMSSSIGLLAGPACMLRAWPERPRHDLRTVARALGLLLTSLAFIAIASRFQYTERLRDTFQASHDPGAGLSAALQAPGYLLLHGYAGIFDPHTALPSSVLLALTLAGLALLVARYRVAAPSERRWLSIGAFFIAAGYGLTYCVRTHIYEPEIFLRVQRYHLFPCAGLVLVLGAMFAPLFQRLSRVQLAGLILPVALSATIIAMQEPIMARRMSRYRLHAEQQPVLAILDEIAHEARLRGYSREDVLGAFDPIEPSWAPEKFNILELLPPIEGNGDRGGDPTAVRDALLASLQPSRVATLLAGTNVSGHLRTSGDASAAGAAIRGSLVRLKGTRKLGAQHDYFLDGLQSFLEYRFEAGQRAASQLEIGGIPQGRTLEVWWAGQDGAFARHQKVVIRAPGGASSAWRVPLEKIPSLGDMPLRAVRILARKPGALSIDAPVLIR